MERQQSQHDGLAFHRIGFWKMRCREAAMHGHGSIEETSLRISVRPSLDCAVVDDGAEPYSVTWRGCGVPQSAMRIADFVEQVFVPEHAASKELSGRIHYQAMLKHVLTPEEVDRVFRASGDRPKTKLTAVPNWPYLGNIRLCDARQEDVQRLISAALERGYSIQTVKHIRSVVSAIFKLAKKKQWFTGENPASLATLPGMVRKEAHSLSREQMKKVLDVMSYPLREMTLMAALTDMNMAEICGLQWKCVNLAEAWMEHDFQPMAPRTIAVRQQWYRGELGSVGRKSRTRDLPIPEQLLPMLRALSRRSKCTGPDDFVFVSRSGMPFSAKQITYRLKTFGEGLEMPWLSWRVFRRAHKTLTFELGMQAMACASL